MGKIKTQGWKHWWKASSAVCVTWRTVRGDPTSRTKGRLNVFDRESSLGNSFELASIPQTHYILRTWPTGTWQFQVHIRDRWLAHYVEDYIVSEAYVIPHDWCKFKTTTKYCMWRLAVSPSDRECVRRGMCVRMTRKTVIGRRVNSKKRARANKQNSTVWSGILLLVQRKTNKEHVVARQRGGPPGAVTLVAKK